MASRRALVDAVELLKKDRRLEVWRERKIVKTNRNALGFAPEGDKEREGDGRTPEGAYVIDARDSRSAFHLSLRVSYPDDSDKARAVAACVSPRPDRVRTTGCMAVTDPEMRKIWWLVATGTRITIRP